MKRFLCILIAIMILIVTLSVPAFATSTDDIGDQSAFEPLFTDILNYPEFTINVAGYTIKSKQPLYNYQSYFGPFTLTWGDGSYRYDIGYVLVGVGAAALPSSVTFGGDYNGTLVGVDSGVCYTYRFDINLAAIDSWKIEIDMGDFNGLVSIDYAYIVNENSIHVTDGVNFTAYAMMQDAEQPYLQEYPMGEVLVPYSYVKRYSQSTVPSEFFVNVEYVFHTAAIEEMSFLFASPNVWPNYYEDNNFQIGGFSLVDLETGTVLDIIDYSVNESTFNSTYEGMTRYSYCATVNLSGIDLSGKSLQFRVYLGSRMPSNDFVYQFTLRDIAYKLPTHSIPWYLRFFNWIKIEIE